MRNKILIAATVGISLFAAAQSQTDKEKPKPTTTTQEPRDAASGQASGKLEQKNAIHRDIAARDVVVPHTTSKPMASDN